MKYLINLNAIGDFIENDDGSFKEKYCSISEKVGARKLGYNVVVLEPGYKSCPFHNHHINEELFLILGGSGTLRFGDEKHSISEGDLIACPPGKRS